MHVGGLALLTLVACSSPLAPAPGGVTIRSDRVEYHPRDRIIVSTTNTADVVIYDDHCGGEVQGFELLGRWNASYGSGRACLDYDAEPLRAAVRIEPHATHVDTFFVNSRAYAGTWRVALLLRASSAEVLAEELRVSNEFKIMVP